MISKQLPKVSAKIRLSPEFERAVLYGSLEELIEDATSGNKIGMLAMANPASAHCASTQGGSLFLMTDSKTGGQYGLCRINPKEAYEEWCLYRKDMNIDTKDCPNLIILLKDEK